MHLLDYDEFNIYTTTEDVKNYITSLISEGIDLSEEIYTMCINHFGESVKYIIDDIFYYED
jgi:hypothetical protein